MRRWVKFWENQETALDGLKEFADGWFARRHTGMQMALEAAKHIGEAETPSDVFREYQDWLKREMELLAEDGKAYQQQVLKAGANLSARPEAPQTDERRTGSRPADTSLLSSSIPRQLPASPMLVLARRIEHPLDVTVKRPPMRANIVGPPTVATRINASIAACHSGAVCLALGSLVM
jgi:hypothetical protein